MASGTRIKNKSAAPVQISAEALLREAVERTVEDKIQKPTTRFADLEELSEWQGRQRSEFEKYVRQAPHNINNFLRYAAFEESQKDLRRARSVFERALAAHPVNVVIWLRYIDSEIKSRNLNHARNLLDRAVTLLPRVDKLWFKYVYVEETIGNVSGCAAIFERWLQWEPSTEAWSAAANLFGRYSEWDKARSIYERMVVVHPEPNNWLKWVRFEEEHGTSDLVREVYSQAVEALGEDFMSEKIFIAWAKFETRLKEYERARSLFRFALDRMPRSKSANLHAAYTKFEKQFGDSDGVEDVVLEKRRVSYEEEARQNPKNYDNWIDLARLEETGTSGGNWEKVRDVYERAIAQIPPSQEKRHWRRYLYLWLFYATWEELTTKDMERVAAIYQACLKIIPHSKWTSAKVWINYAMFRLRQDDLTGARKVLGTAIGKCPKKKLFKEYIQTEIKLFEFDRARQLYAKYIAWDPTNAEAWKSFAEMERGLADTERARALYALAISEDMMDMPELLWKEYIDFEVENEEYQKARELYEKLLKKTSHVKVWTSYAQFEASVPDEEEPEEEDEEDNSLSEATKARVRNVFERGYKAMKEQDLKEERVTLLNAWRAFENAHGSPEDIAKVQKQMPSKVKKRRKLDDDTYEEYMDWLFPADNESEKKLSNLLQMAQKWKQAQANGEAA